jgi:uncharacterized membrane protein YbaN (DUF454 family)
MVGVTISVAAVRAFAKALVDKIDVVAVDTAVPRDAKWMVVVSPIVAVTTSILMVQIPMATTAQVVAMQVPQS